LSDFLNLNHLYYSDIGGSDFAASLPNQTMPKAKKGKKWQDGMMDRLEEIAIYQVARNLSLRDYRKMYEGRLVYQDLEDTSQTTQAIAEFRLQSEASLPTYIKHFDILGIIVNQLSGEYDTQKDGVRVDSIDNFSQSEYFREKNALIRKYTEEYFRLELQKGLVLMGVNPEDQNFETEEERQQYAQFIQEQQNKLMPPDQLEANLSKDFKTIIAEWAELTLEADKIRFDMEDLDLEELVDYLLTGRYFRHYHIGYDFYRPERWSPETTFFSQDLDIVYPQDGEYAGRLHFLSGAELLQRYGDRIPKNIQEKLYGYQIEASSRDGVTFKESLKRHFGDTHIVPYKSYYQHDLAYKMQSALGTPMGVEYRNDENGEQVGRPAWLDDNYRYGSIGNRFSQYLRDDIEVRTDVFQVTEAYWRGAKMVGLLTIENEVLEEPYQVEVEEDLLKDFLKENSIKQLKTVSLQEAREKKELNTVAWFYVPQVWRGKKVNAGNSSLLDDFVFDVEPMPFQIRGDSNLFDVKLPVAGIITSGIGQKIRPYQVKHNLAMNLIENALEKHIGSFLMFDLNFLMSQYKNETGGTTADLIEEWREDIRDVGFGFYDSSPQNTGGQNPNAQAAQVLRVSFVEDVQYYMQLAEFYQRKAYEQIGVTASRIGNPDKYQTQEGVQQGAKASYAQTERIYKKFNTAKRKERELHLTVAQYCVKDNKDIVVDYTRPDGVRVLKKFTDENFWLRKINIIPINDSAQRKSLERFREMMLQNNTMNSDLLDYARLFTSDSFVTLINHATQARKRAEKQVQAGRQHDQAILDKQLQSQAQDKAESRAFEASENQKDRENDIREAHILAVSKIADSNYDKSYLKDLEEVAEQNLDDEQRNRGLDLQEKEISRKENNDAQNLKLAYDKFKLEKEKLAVTRRKSENDRYIATINKN
jgi:hypothetical protein